MATMTVMPAPSSASVSRRSVSGESSTTSATSRFLGSVIIAVQRLEGCHVLIKVEAVDQGAHLRHEAGMLGVVGAYFVELDLDRPDIAQLPKIDEFLDMPGGRPGPAARLPLRGCNLIVCILPLDLEQLADQFQQSWNIDRLHQIAVVEWLRQRRAMRLQCAGRNHQDTGLMMTGRTQRLRHRPSVHARHRDIQQEQVRPAMLRERETARAVRCAEQDKAKRCQYLAQEIAMDGIIVGDQDRL